MTVYLQCTNLDRSDVTLHLPNRVTCDCVVTRQVRCDSRNLLDRSNVTVVTRQVRCDL